MENIKHKTLTVDEIKSNRGAISNSNQLHKESLSFQEKLASKITNVVGGLCVFCNNTQQLSLPFNKHHIVIF